MFFRRDGSRLPHHVSEFAIATSTVCFGQESAQHHIHFLSTSSTFEFYFESLP